MIQLKRVLVPTDFSDYSKPAMEYGCAIANRFDSELHLLHVVPDPAMLVPEAYSFSVEAIETQSKLMIEDAQKRLDLLPSGDFSSNQPVRREIRSDAAFLEIIDYAKRHDIDLLVIGTHGRSGLMHILMGSVAERVVRKSPCPVLTVKPEGHQFVMP